MARKNELTDVTVQIHHETDKAILVSDDGDEAKARWLPLSQIEIEKTNEPGTVVVTMPTWLAKEKRFI